MLADSAAGSIRRCPCCDCISALFMHALYAGTGRQLASIKCSDAFRGSMYATSTRGRSSDWWTVCADHRPGPKSWQPRCKFCPRSCAYATEKQCKKGPSSLMHNL
eukprot:351937-Chlamydomonas_euryale.AAC.5